jgi:hypothetical protein
VPPGARPRSPLSANESAYGGSEPCVWLPGRDGVALELPGRSAHTNDEMPAGTIAAPRGPRHPRRGVHETHIGLSSVQALDRRAISRPYWRRPQPVNAGSASAVQRAVEALPVDRRARHVGRSCSSRIPRFRRGGVTAGGAGSPIVGERTLNGLCALGVAHLKPACGGSVGEQQMEFGTLLLLLRIRTATEVYIRAAARTRTDVPAHEKRQPQKQATSISVCVRQAARPADAWSGLELPCS